MLRASGSEITVTSRRGAHTPQPKFRLNDSVPYSLPDRERHEERWIERLLLLVLIVPYLVISRTAANNDLVKL